MRKKLLYTLLGMVVMFAGTVAAAPVLQNFTNIAPFITDTYNNGLANQRWLSFFTKYASTTQLTVSGQTSGCAQFDATGFLTSVGTNCGSGSGEDNNWTIDMNGFLTPTTTIGVSLPSVLQIVGPIHGVGGLTVDGGTSGGGDLNLNGGVADPSGPGGSVIVRGAAGDIAGGQGGNLVFLAGSAQAGDNDGGGVQIFGGSASGNGVGGSLTFTAGAPNTGAGGQVLIDNNAGAHQFLINDTGTGVSSNGNVAYLDTSLMTNNHTFQFPDSDGIVCLTTTGCGSSGGDNNWLVSGGVLTPTTTIGVALPSTLQVVGTSTLATTTTSVLNGVIYVSSSSAQTVAQLTAQIQSAINTCAALYSLGECGKVHLESGVYTISPGVITLASNVNLEGDGESTKILSTTQAGGTELFNTQNVNNIKISDIFFSGINTSPLGTIPVNNTWAFFVQNDFNVSFQNVRFEQFYEDIEGNHVSGASFSHVHDFSGGSGFGTEDITNINTLASSTYSDIIGYCSDTCIRLEGAQNITVKGSLFFNASIEIGNAEGAGPAQNITISGNNWVSNTTDAITLINFSQNVGQVIAVGDYNAGVNNINITGNTFDLSTTTSGNSSALIAENDKSNFTTAISNINFSSNTIISENQGQIHTKQPGISGMGNSGVALRWTIAGNTFASTTGDAIKMQSPVDTKIHDNIVWNFGTNANVLADNSCIYIGGTSSSTALNNEIYNNHCVGPVIGGTSAGIYVDNPLYIQGLRMDQNETFRVTFPIAYFSTAPTSTPLSFFENIGIGTTTPYSLLSVQSTTTGSTSPQISSWVIGSSSPSFIVDSANHNGNVGIGTSTPGTLFSIQNIANFNIATSTFYGNGINLTNGCYAIGGNCLSLSSLTGILPISSGGTNQGSQTTNGVNYFDGTEITSGTSLVWNGSILAIRAGTTNLSAPLTFGGLSQNPEIALFENSTDVIGLGVGSSEFRIEGGASGSNHISFGKYSKTGPTFTEQMRITNAGLLGIATSTPGSTLSVAGGVSIGINYGVAAPSNGLIIQGNTGIGTNSPGKLLELKESDSDGVTNDALRLNNGAGSASGRIGIGFFQSNGTSNDSAQISSSPGASFAASTLFFSVADTNKNLQDRMAILFNGNVGIGTSTPSNLLTIEGTTSASVFYAASSTATSTFNDGLNLNGGCFSINTVCLTQNSGTVTSIATNNGLTGGTITTTGTIGLAAIAAGTALANNTSATAVPVAIATSSWFGTGIGGQILAWNNGVPQWIATSSINNLAATYPLQMISNTLSLAFGTTTANTWNLLQNFSNATTSQFTSTSSSFLATSGGNVGIGTSSPTTGELVVQGNSNTAINIWNTQNNKFLDTFTGATERFGINYTSGGNLELQSFGGTKMIINDQGNNVSIGTSNNGSPLTIKSATSIGNAFTTLAAPVDGLIVVGTTGIGTSSPFAQFSLATPNGTTGVLTSLFAIASSTATATTTLFIVKNTGNVGLGTSSPMAQFALSAPSSTVNFTPIDVIASIINAVTYVFQEIDSWGHLITSGPVPVLSSCGTSSISGNDRNGTITLTGVALVSCTMAFANAYAATPECVVSDNTTASVADISSVSASAVTFGLSVGVSSGALYYICQQHQ